MSECSPYIRQAVERCNLPIKVRAYPGQLVDIWTTGYLRQGRIRITTAMAPKLAAKDYLSAVKELTK